MALLDGYALRVHDKIDSTNEEAKRLIKAEEALQGLVLMAKEQGAGYGRNEKAWESPIGNLHTSIIINPDAPLENVAQVSFVTAIALGNVLAEILPESKIQYKWPNDLLVDGKKIAGILLEYISGWLVIGVGLNVEVTPNIENPVTSIKLSGNNDLKAEQLLEKFVLSLDKSLKLWKKSGFTPIRDSWMKRAFKHNERITVNLGKEQISGIFGGLDSGGNLELITDGEVRLIASGEVFF